MARTKSTKKTSNSKTFNSIQGLIDRFMKHYYGSINSVEQARDVIKALESYGSKMSIPSLTTEEQRILGQYNGNSKEARKSIKVKAQSVIAKAERQERLLKDYQEKVQTKLEGQKDLLENFQELAEQLHQVTKSSNLFVYDELHEQYKQAQKAVLAHAGELNDLLSGEEGSAQKRILGEIHEVSKGVNEHTRDIDEYRKAAKQRIKQATLKAAEMTSEMTVGQFLGQFVEASGLKLTGKQLEALQGTSIKVLLSAEEVKQLESGDTTQALAVINSIAKHSGTDTALIESLQELIRINGDAPIGDLPVMALPANVQIAVIARAFEALTLATDNPKEKALLGQLANSLSRDIQGLLSGEKTHLTVAGNVDGHIHVVSIPLEALLKNPLDAISTLGSALFDSGIREHGLTVMLSNPVQNQALLEIQGVAFDQKAILDVSNNADNQLALTETFEQLGVRESQALTELREAGHEPKPLTPEQVMGVALSVVTTLNAIKLAQDPEAILALKNGNTPQSLGQLFGSNPGLLEGQNPKGLEGQNPGAIEGHAPKAIMDAPKPKNSAQRSLVLEKVGAILNTLEGKIDNEQYDAFKMQAYYTFNKLQVALDGFESDDDMKPETLHQNMSAIIKDALPMFDKSPSLFAAFKNAMIHVANFFRSLVGASQIGLFRPDTHTALKETKQGLDKTIGPDAIAQTEAVEEEQDSTRLVQ